MRTLALALVGLLAAALITPAAAQGNDELDLDVLHASEAAVLADLETAGTRLLEIAASIQDANDDVRRAEVLRELLADDLARTIDDRQTPEQTRRQFAIHQYVNGDPVLETVLLEFLTLSAEIAPVTERAIYNSVIDDATDRLAASDAQLAEISDEIGAAQQLRLDRLDTVAELELTRLAQNELVLQLNADLALVREDIAFAEEIRDSALLTGIPGQNENNGRPALAVKIDNVSQARPQVGINQADVVIEELVEGNVTRLIAIFHSQDSNPIGPVRSARTSDINILSNLNNPLFANSGGNANVMGRVRRSELIDVGASNAPGAFYRQGGRPAPHNLFSTTDSLRAAGGDRAGTPPAMFAFRRPGEGPPSTAGASDGVSIGWGSTRVRYAWDADREGWLRSQDGVIHTDASGVAVAPANVIIRFIRYGVSPADRRSPEAQVEGTGDVWVFVAGRLIAGRWEQDDLTDVTRYLDVNGDAIELTRGVTWIALAPEDSATLL